MGEKKPSLGEFEELILLATLRLGDNAYGMTIRQTVEEATKHSISVGAIYTTLERLEHKGLLKSCHGDATSERGGRAKRYFRIERSGAQALTEAERVREQLRSGLQPVRGMA